MGILWKACDIKILRSNPSLKSLYSLKEEKDTNIYNLGLHTMSLLNENRVRGVNNNS